MVGQLLLRGMVVGLLAGVLAFGFLRLVGEPQVDRAIAFEQAHEHDAAMAENAMPASEPELVSRPVQAGLGLFTGVTVYCAALGGLFAIAFALVDGRLGRLGPRATAALLALAAFVAITLVPFAKYPANPPAVGESATIGARTGLFFALVALSLAAAVAAGLLGRLLVARFGAWNGAVATAVAFLAAVVAICWLMPAIDEVPADFPASVLWRFRVASLGAQALLWATLGLGFGALAETVVRTGAVLPNGLPRRG